jgi:hypothetical protein
MTEPAYLWLLALWSPAILRTTTWIGVAADPSSAAVRRTLLVEPIAQVNFVDPPEASNFVRRQLSLLDPASYCVD